MAALFNKIFAPKIFKSLDDIFVYNFFKALETRDMRYLYLKLPPKRKIKHFPLVFDTWAAIYNSYLEKISDNVSMNYYRLLDEVSYLEYRYTIINTLVYTLTESNKKTIGKELAAWGVIFNIKGKVAPQQENLERFLRAATNKILRKKSELETISKKKAKTPPMNILKDKIQLEHITGVKINIYTMVMAEWLEIRALAESISESRKKQATNG